MQKAADNLPADRKLRSFPGNHPQLVSANSTGILNLAAANCKIYGSKIAFETKYKNLGFWGHVDDEARWTLDLVKPGCYEVFLNLNYACPANTSGNQYEFSVGTIALKGKVVATKGWDDYKRLQIGRLDLKAGQSVARINALAPLKGFLLDFRSIELVPVPSSSSSIQRD